MIALDGQFIYTFSFDIEKKEIIKYINAGNILTISFGINNMNRI